MTAFRFVGVGDTINIIHFYAEDWDYENLRYVFEK